MTQYRSIGFRRIRENKKPRKRVHGEVQFAWLGQLERQNIPFCRCFYPIAMRAQIKRAYGFSGRHFHGHRSGKREVNVPNRDVRCYCIDRETVNPNRRKVRILSIIRYARIGSDFCSDFYTCAKQQKPHQ